VFMIVFPFWRFVCHSSGPGHDISVARQCRTARVVDYSIHSAQALSAAEMPAGI
jgi:hypothetical protein